MKSKLLIVCFAVTIAVTGLAHGELMGLRREHQPQIDAITQRAINELAAHLDTGQHNKLEIIYVAAHKHWEISNRAGASKTLPDVGSPPRQDGSH